MRQHTTELNLETSVTPFEKTTRQIPSVDLRRVDVYAVGVDGSGETLSYWNQLKDFWSTYIKASAGILQRYSGIREINIIAER